MTPKSERSLRASELVRTRLSKVRRCRVASDRENVSLGTTDAAEDLRTLFLIRGSVWLLFGEGVFGVSFKLVGIDVSSVPDEILEELVAVFFLNNEASGLDDVLNVLDKLATVRTELVLVDRRMVENIVQRVVDLGIVG
jgi:hypothetical protein